MRNPGEDIEDPPAVEEAPTDWPVKCQVCGTIRQPRDSTLCRVCGEPILIWGWAP